MSARIRLSAHLTLTLGALVACEGAVERPPPPANTGVYGFANGCYAMDATRPGETDTRWLEASVDESGDEPQDTFRFSARTLEAGSRFVMRAADLGVYLFYDADGRYLVSDDGPLLREEALMSDLSTVDDTYISGGEWALDVSAHDAERFQLQNRRTGRYLGVDGLVDDVADAAVVAFYPTDGCAEFPELTVDAEGSPMRTTFDDGDLYGIVDAHSHMFTNFGFGGGGIFHGSPFHRLGVEHALPDCQPFHGTQGRKDLFGYGYDNAVDFDQDVLVTAFVTGRLPEPNHETAGYPDFTDWPNARHASTHQTQYYRWLERAYLGGLRLVVQHATTNHVLCEMIVGNNVQPVRYSCNDMVAADREIEETYNLERYIDAQSGGPGMGWLHVVTTPAEARETIAAGRLAVILGIETSNLFDCFLVPRAGMPACDEAHVVEELDRYEERGVRVLFPVHKYDNRFSAGDGHRGLTDLGNFVNTGHWSNYTEDCDPMINTVFDRGELVFAGINMPRDDFLAPPPNDMSGFAMNPVGTVTPFLDQLMAGSAPGEWCQNAGMTALGERLLELMMDRGMIIELDHFPRRSYQRAFEILTANDYPAAGTHGLNNDGLLYDLGGVSKTGLGRCSAADRAGAMGERLTSRIDLIRAHGGYPAEGFGFDLNGFAGAPAPRFGDDSDCSDPQSNPITYPFTSYAGDVTFDEPHVGNRTLDFNEEGMITIGLLPELIEDARHDGVTDATLEPLFRSAEGYIRMWERAEQRAAARR
ncbi:MAG: hypothetical protein AB7S26_18610 [Sandaracinaceae bacterium]